MCTILYPHRTARGRRHNGFTAFKARISFLDGRTFYDREGHSYIQPNMQAWQVVKIMLKGGASIKLRADGK